MTAWPETRGQEPNASGQAVTRFAPSPTGRLHLGHAYSALLAHRFARDREGRFLLRIEDIDPGRSRAEHVAGIFDDLAWLGLDWDGEVVFQSQRLELYDEALGRLKAMDLLYPCFCTRADIVASLSAPHGPEGAIYPGTCRTLPEPDLARTHAWRLAVAKAAALAGELFWNDDGQERRATPEQFGDVVLARKDAPASYHLAVTVDDAAQGVTDIVRGRDLHAATHVHRLLQALLGLPAPRYHHHALLADANGKRLAKRSGAPTLAALREAGADPEALREALLAGRMPTGYSLAED
jgi:glutamyl-Q tRNA(Asp) synthetase